MMITCAINGCPSTQYMKINGEQISFFAFPEDDAIKSQWLENCNLASGIVSNTKTPYLCELHFEKIDFTPSKDLKADAVPTLFGHIEEPSKKCSTEDILKSTLKTMSFKDKSLDKQFSTPSESLSLQDNVAEQSNKSKMDVSIDSEKDANGCDPSFKHQKSKAKTYRLTIRIDKIRNMSVGKRPVCLTDAKNMKFQEPVEKKLKESFSDLQKVCSDTKKHFICAICRVESDSEKAYEKHVRLHVSIDPLNPFKCHQCFKTFSSKDNTKQHYLKEHPKVKIQTGVVQINSPSVTTIFSQIDYQCTNCNLNFKTEQSYNEHLKSHETKEGMKYNISETNNIISVPNPLTGNQIGILQAVKFSCRVCQQEFDNVCEVDAHTKTHLMERKSSQDGLKCNICKKMFTDNVVFSEHLKQHLSRAYPCPVCSKAFINRTTLKAHLETHSKS